MTSTGAKKYVDLHVHTRFSDGTFTPEQTVDHAVKVGLSAISITDHDIIDGIEPAIKHAGGRDIEIVPGVELSTELTNQTQRSEMHILGYFIDWKNPVLDATLKEFRKKRHERAFKILEKLSKLGLGLNEKRFFDGAGKGSIGRLHFARAMIEQGIVRTINDAFFKYLGHGKPAYVPKKFLSPEEAIKLISDAGGIAVLAHPFYAHYSDKNLLETLIRSGLAGIEVWHSKHPPSMVDHFSSLASAYGLLRSGGSDCHGGVAGDEPLMGSVKIPYSILDKMKKYHESHRRRDPR
ncbi:MAG: PHP domain-containing protein [Endomicrobiales bacterium]|nr:PHP domain-containing protein [Endomicrobiales bacterium]